MRMKPSLGCYQSIMQVCLALSRMRRVAKIRISLAMKKILALVDSQITKIYQMVLLVLVLPHRSRRVVHLQSKLKVKQRLDRRQKTRVRQPPAKPTKLIRVETRPLHQAIKRVHL